MIFSHLSRHKQKATAIVFFYFPIIFYHFHSTLFIIVYCATSHFIFFFTKPLYILDDATAQKQ